MRRRLLSPKWLALHALLIACLVSFSLLGKWQLTRAESVDGTIRNFAYALQWWIFAGFAVFFWWKMLRSDLAEDRALGGSAGSPTSAEPGGSTGSGAAGEASGFSDLASSAAGSSRSAGPTSMEAAGPSGPPGRHAARLRRASVAGAPGRGGHADHEPGPEILDEDDPEDAALIAYNRYLAQLNERHQRARSR